MPVVIAVAVAHAAAGLLLVAGVAKLLRPTAAQEAFAHARQRAVPLWLVRGLGAGEIVLGASVVVVGGELAFVILALAYGVFALVSMRQRSAGAGCGCLGARTGRVGRPHIVMDLTAAAGAAGAALGGAPSLLAFLPPGPTGAASTALLALALVLAILVMTRLPELEEAVALSEGVGRQ